MQLNVSIEDDNFQNKQLQGIINNINNPIFSLKENRIVFANKNFLELSSCNNLEQINMKYTSFNDIFYPENGYYINCLNSKEFNNNDVRKVCLLNSHNEKEYFSIEKLNLDGEESDIFLLNNISNEIEYENKLKKLLYTDTLTSLPNRACLISNLQNNSLDLTAITIFDIHSFKEVNDFFGHKVGDYILKAVSKTISEQIESQDDVRLYKFSSDTYCLTYEGNEEDQYLELVKLIVGYIYKEVYFVDQHEIDVRICAGISFSSKANKLITADIALQEAKKEHKDYLVFYEELDNLKEYENNMLWTKKLKSALRDDRIVVYYQPLVNNKTMRIDKFECLVRMIDKDGKVISPFFFLDVSKKTNNYKRITRIVVEKSCKMFENLPYEFSVNISYEDIEDPTFLDFIKDVLKKYNVSNKMVFEILEDEGIKNYSLLLDFIDEVQGLGCKVALDDFGSGYSNFEHLLKMNIDYLKIDASLIKNIAKDENSYKITKTVVEFAKNLNLSTIAEFVENKDILDIVKDLDINYSQGYHFSAPIADPNIFDSKKDYNE
jgi:diguanylate cyclase (GGDEF)-like protein